MIATAVVTVKSVPGTLGRNTAMLGETWASIYATFPDNAFDYVGKPFYNDNDGTIQLWNGSKMITYVEVPF